MGKGPINKSRGEFIEGAQENSHFDHYVEPAQLRNNNSYLDPWSEATSYAVGFAVSWKRCYRRVRTSFCPENVRNYRFSPQNDLDVSPRRPLSRALSRFSRSGAHWQEITSGVLFRSKWVKKNYNPRLDWDFSNPIPDRNRI